MQIGKKVRELRKAQRMTLEDLSRLSGVQTATLSRIENLKMTGTLESHMQIARALGVSIADLYSDVEISEKRVDVKKKSTRTDVFVHSEKSSYEILTSKVLNKKMMPILLKIEPQGRTNKEQNQIGTERFVFVLDGKAEVTIDRETFSITKGNSLYFDASLPHYFVNSGKSTVRIVSVTTPVAL